ncbi:MAG: phospho-sugar mutase [Spirochaetaceae bacterium]|jgi:phosphoglucomutase|nr:phospho-sugar mutase [Spirochaetaceae bacterium]
MTHDEIRAKAREYLQKEEDARFKGEVERLIEAEDWAALEDRFFRTLEFGTGGLRGVIGGGFNRMNTLVVKSATQGLATYIIKAFPEKALAGTLSAVIAYDSRHYSREFAEAAARVFAGNGMRAYIFSSLRPTPELSFAIRRLKTDTGIVVTASHNPPQYNGYKAYWNDGSQVIEPHDTGIIEEVGRVTVIKELPEAEAVSRGLYKVIDKEIDEPYREMVVNALFRPALIREKAGEVKIVYTPLHGTGAFPVEAVLSGLGLNVITVPEQREGNGDFPTVSFPNPEEAAALEMAVALGKKVGADVVMATDPDADRFGVAVPNGVTVNGESGFTLITGNQMGALLADYVCLSLKELGKLPPKPAIVKSIVTTGMQDKVAALYGVETLECLTGFKWIANLMRLADEGKIPHQIIFGNEESYGYLVENDVRDKDGVSAAALTAEMTIYWRSKGKTLLDRLNELYEKTGYWEEMGISKYFQGPQGPAIMAGVMAEYRKSPPKTLGGIAVVKVRDLQEGVVRFIGDPSKKEQVGLPKSDVLQFYLEDGTIVSARPSGTEPKIKFYATCCGKTGNGGLEAAKKEVAGKLAAIKADIRKVIGA